MTRINHFESVDLADPRHQEAYQEAFEAWGQMMDRGGRMASGATEAATSLEEALQDRFGLSDDEAWHISSAALRDRREIYRD